MIGFDRMLITVAVLELNGPRFRRFIIGAAVDARAHFDFAAEFSDFQRGRFPHHAGSFSRITEGINQCLDHFRPVAVWRTLREKRVLDRASEGKTADALGGPVRRDLFAAHPPNFFGVALEENVEETFAELIAHPLLEIPRMANRKKSRFQPRQNADCRSYDAELDQRFERLQRVSEKFAVIINFG